MVSFLSSFWKVSAALGSLVSAGLLCLRSGRGEEWLCSSTKLGNYAFARLLRVSFQSFQFGGDCRVCLHYSADEAVVSFTRIIL